jgi:hypothetical protein
MLLKSLKALPEFSGAKKIKVRITPLKTKPSRTLGVETRKNYHVSQESIESVMQASEGIEDKGLAKAMEELGRTLSDPNI